MWGAPIFPPKKKKTKKKIVEKKRKKTKNLFVFQHNYHFIIFLYHFNLIEFLGGFFLILSWYNRGFFGGGCGIFQKWGWFLCASKVTGICREVNLYYWFTFVLLILPVSWYIERVIMKNSIKLHSEKVSKVWIHLMNLKYI